jgi:hypothetical protein
MTYFYTGDIPATVLIVSPSLNGEDIALDTEDAATVLLTDPAGTQITTLVGAISDQTIEVTFPATTVLADPGIYTLTILIDHTGGPTSQGIQQADPVRLVVDDTAAEWATLVLTRDQWIDARTMADAMLYDLLTMAREQVIEYAPVLADGVAVPLRYRLAQIAQAKNVYNGSLVDAGSGDIGNETFTIRPFPLDWQIKQMLRPRRGTPVVG